MLRSMNNCIVTYVAETSVRDSIDSVTSAKICAVTTHRRKTLRTMIPYAEHLLRKGYARLRSSRSKPLPMRVRPLQLNDQRPAKGKPPRSNGPMNWRGPQPPGTNRLQRFSQRASVGQAQLDRPANVAPFRSRQRPH